MQLRLIFYQALVTNFFVIKQVLDHMKGVLHPRPYLGLHPLQRFGKDLECSLSHFGDRAAPTGHTPFDIAVNHPNRLSLHNLVSFLSAGVARICKDHRFFTVQNFMGIRHVALVGRCREKAVDQTRIVILTDMRLHSKAPFVSLLCLVHLWVTCMRFVLGRWGCRNDGSVHHSPLTHHQATFTQMGVDLSKHPITQCIGFEQPARLEHRSGVGCSISTQVDP